MSLLERLIGRKNQIEVQIKSFEDEYFNAPEEEIELIRRKRTYDINEKFYGLLIEKKTEYLISQQGFVSDINILKKATIPNSSISPNKKIVFSSFLGFGILVSLIIVFIKYLLHNQITSINEIVKYSNS